MKHENGCCVVTIFNKCINYQNANQKSIGSALAYQMQCTLPPRSLYQTSFSIFGVLYLRLAVDREIFTLLHKNVFRVVKFSQFVLSVKFF